MKSIYVEFTIYFGIIIEMLRDGWRVSLHPLTKVHVYYKYVAEHPLGLNSLHIINFCK